MQDCDDAIDCVLDELFHGPTRVPVLVSLLDLRTWGLALAEIPFSISKVLFFQRPQQSPLPVPRRSVSLVVRTKLPLHGHDMVVLQ
jgi:uncharacterized membrane protein